MTYTPLRFVVSALSSENGNVFKHDLSCLIYMTFDVRIITQIRVGSLLVVAGFTWIFELRHSSNCYGVIFLCLSWKIVMKKMKT